MKKWLYLSVLSFFLSSMTIWLMSHKSLQIALGIMFWLGLIAGFLFLIPISKARKSDQMYAMYIEKNAPKFFRLFSNTPAIVADVMFMVSLVGIVVALNINDSPPWLEFGSAFGCVFSLEMHGIFNGRNYAYLNDWGYH